MNSGTINRIRDILYAYFNDTLPSKLEDSILEWFADKGCEEEKYAVLEELWHELVTENHHYNEKLLHCYREITQLLGIPFEEPVYIKPAFRFPWSTVVKFAAVFIPIIAALASVWFYQHQDERPDQHYQYTDISISIKESNPVKFQFEDYTRAYISPGTIITYPYKWTKH